MHGRVTRVGAILLLLTAAALLAAAAVERWGSVCAAGIETTACELRQSHLYDAMPVAAPWAPVGHTAVLTGLALLVLGVAVVVLGWQHLPGPRGLVRTGGVVLGSTALWMGLPTLLSGWSGRVVTLPGEGPASLLWALVWPLLALVWCWGAVALSSVRHAWAGLLAMLVAAASPLVGGLYVAPVIFGSSYDTAAWTELVYAGALALAALVVVPASRRTSRRFAVRTAGATGAL